AAAGGGRGARSPPPPGGSLAGRGGAPAGGAGGVLDASGYAPARRQATVSAKITGKITEVLIEEGMRVAEGAVLARLDDTEAKAQLALSRAQLAAARSQDGEIGAQLQQAERDYKRSQELFNKQLVPEQSMDAARAQRDTLRAKLPVNHEQIRLATDPVSAAQVQLANTVARSPIAGIAIAKPPQPRHMIYTLPERRRLPCTGIGSLVDLESVEIQVAV